MPLAIELAAARIKLLSPDQILARLEHQLDLLAAGSRDLPARQQTLRAAIAWSYDILDDGSKRLLDRLSVFATGCDLESADAICGPSSEIGGDMVDAMTALADQSLVKTDEAPGGEVRFRLFDTIREYAAEHLEARGETEMVRARHRDWYVAFVERAAPELSGDDQRRWLERLELEHDDIRAVLDRAVAAPDPPVAIGLAFSMWRFWQKHGHLAEARRRLEAMAAMPWSHDDPRLRARLMEALGGTYWWQGEIGLMGPRYDEALELWESIGDKAEIANAYYNASFQYAVPNELTKGTRIDVDRLGERYLRTSLELFREIGDRRGEANTLWGLGNYHYFQAYEDLGVPSFTEALDIFRSVGDRTMEAWSLHMRGTALLRRGNVAEARDNISHAMRHFYAASDTAGITLCLDDLSAVEVAEGNLERAAILRGAARNLTVITGAGLASYVEDLYETGARPKIVEHMSGAELERLSAQGAAMTLDEAVSYALGGVTADIDDGVTA